MARVIVTGGSGKVGRACVEDLIQHGYEVFNLDLVRPAKELCRFIQIDLTDFGEAIEGLSRIVEPNETLLYIDKARRVLGYEPQYSWRKS